MPAPLVKAKAKWFVVIAMAMAKWSVMIVMAMAKCIAPLVKAKANRNVPIAMVMAKLTLPRSYRYLHAREKTQKGPCRVNGTSLW